RRRGLPRQPRLLAARTAHGAAAARPARARRPRLARRRGPSRVEAHRRPGAQPSARALPPRAPYVLHRRLLDGGDGKTSEHHPRLRRADSSRMPAPPTVDLSEARKGETLNGHYDEGTLADYLESPEACADRGALERHLAVCRRCRGVLDELRELEAALQSDEPWELAASIDAQRDAPESISSLAAALTREEEQAAQRLGRIVESPIMFRRANVVAGGELRNGGAIRVLCTRSRNLREKQPMHALTLADAAVALCERLAPERYPPTLVAELRGGAWPGGAHDLPYSPPTGQ